MSAKPQSRVVHQSWTAYDMIEKTCIKHDTPTMTPESTVHPLEPLEVQDNSLDPLWEKVWNLKARALETLPSKVKSLDVARRENNRRRREVRRKSMAEGSAAKTVTPETVGRRPSEQGKVEGMEQEKPEVNSPEKEAKLKRKASATFHTSEDGKLVTATFDMLGVRKQDMHVSFRGNKLIVTWRRVKVTEQLEEGVLVREKKDKQYTQTIPLPDGVTFEEVKASRDGERLVLRYPNLRCVRVKPPHAEDSRASSSTVCSEPEDFVTCLLAPSTLLEVFEVNGS